MRQSKAPAGTPRERHGPPSSRCPAGAAFPKGSGAAGQSRVAANEAAWDRVDPPRRRYFPAAGVGLGSPAARRTRDSAADAAISASIGPRAVHAAAVPPAAGRLLPCPSPSRPAIRAPQQQRDALPLCHAPVALGVAEVPLHVGGCSTFAARRDCASRPASSGDHRLPGSASRPPGARRPRRRSANAAASDDIRLPDHVARCSLRVVKLRPRHGSGFIAALEGLPRLMHLRVPSRNGRRLQCVATAVECSRNSRARR